jgi:polar amino acid transport system substrate-binding protein
MNRTRKSALAAILVLGATACGVGTSEASKRATTAFPSTSASPTTTKPITAPCPDNSSYAPFDELPDAKTLTADPVMEHVLKEGKLVVAVDESTKGLSSRDPVSGQLVGLEIDLARELARTILGSGDDAHVKFKTVAPKEKIDFPAEGKVDIAISAISMTCDRWTEVAFSSRYFEAKHAFLVRSDSSIHALGDLAGKRVCMTKGSTSIATLRDDVTAAVPLNPKPEPVLVDQRADCLLALEEGQADAYFGHDTFLVGMMEQDPNMRIVPQGTAQDYGIATNPKATGFVQYVNTVLAQLRDSGWFAREYTDQLGPLYSGTGVPLPAVPTANTSRPLP